MNNSGNNNIFQNSGVVAAQNIRRSSNLAKPFKKSNRAAPSTSATQLKKMEVKSSSDQQNMEEIKQIKKPNQNLFHPAQVPEVMEANYETSTLVKYTSTQRETGAQVQQTAAIEQPMLNRELSIPSATLITQLTEEAPLDIPRGRISSPA